MCLYCKYKSQHTILHDDIYSFMKSEYSTGEVFSTMVLILVSVNGREIGSFDLHASQWVYKWPSKILWV